MPQPKISIVIPTLNAAHTLERAILSVIHQSYPNIELIVIDSVSCDQTAEIIRKYKNNISKCLSEPDEGIYDAMNKGIDLATGEWLYFMGSDDILYNNEIIEKVFSQANYSKFDVIYGNVQFKHAQNVYDGKFTSYKLLYKNICHQSMFTTRKLLLAKGKFNLRYTLLADYEFNMNWFNDKKVRRTYIDLIVAVYNEDGISFNRPDTNFIKDKKMIIKKYFSLADRLHLYYDNYTKKTLKV